MSKERYLAAAVVGIIIGLNFGYVIFALSHNNPISFSQWATGGFYPWTLAEATIYAAMGAVLSVATIFVIRR